VEGTCGVLMPEMKFVPAESAHSADWNPSTCKGVECPDKATNTEICSNRKRMAIAMSLQCSIDDEVRTQTGSRDVFTC
jgi:hypothetical protein